MIELAVARHLVVSTFAHVGFGLAASMAAVLVGLVRRAIAARE